MSAVSLPPAVLFGLANKRTQLERRRAGSISRLILLATPFKKRPCSLRQRMLAFPKNPGFSVQLEKYALLFGYSDHFRFLSFEFSPGWRTSTCQRKSAGASGVTQQMPHLPIPVILHEPLYLADFRPPKYAHSVGPLPQPSPHAFPPVAKTIFLQGLRRRQSPARK